MGDANKRGPFEVRKALAIARNAEQAEQRRLAAEAREAAMTPAERHKRDKARLILSTVLPLVMR